MPLLLAACCFPCASFLSFVRFFSSAPFFCLKAWGGGGRGEPSILFIPNTHSPSSRKSRETGHKPLAVQDQPPNLAFDPNT